MYEMEGPRRAYGPVLIVHRATARHSCRASIVRRSPGTSDAPEAAPNRYPVSRGECFFTPRLASAQGLTTSSQNIYFGYPQSDACLSSAASDLSARCPRRRMAPGQGIVHRVEAGGEDQYLELPLARFLDLLAGPEPAPGGGGAAAIAVAMAAGLCAMAARLSVRQLAAEADTLRIDSERISSAAASLIQADAESYLGVIEAQRLPREDAQARRRQIGAALSAASEVPMQVTELAVQAAQAAAWLAAAGNPNLRGDAITGALLASAGARAAATLVAINLASSPDDDRPARASGLAAEAQSLAVTAALAAKEHPPVQSGGDPPD
jgi:methenyltetrahydrofolate cyclohydrolase